MAQAEVKVVASLDNSQFKAGLSGMSSQMAGLKGMIAGAFSVGAVVAFGRSMLQTADAMRDMAEATGISLNSAVAIKTAFAESGLKTEKFEQAMGKLRNAEGDVISQNKTMIDALAKLKISQEEFVGIGADKQLELIAKKYAEAGGSADAFRAVSEIFGEKVGPKIIEVLGIINNVGLETLKSQTADATKGINDLADAQERLDKIGSKAIIASGNAVSYLAEGWRLAKVAAVDYYEKISGKQGWKGVLSAVLSGGASSLAGKAVQNAFIGGPAGTQPTTAGQAGRQSDIAKLIENQNAGKVKVMDSALRADEKESAARDKMYKAQDDLASEYASKRKDLLAGKGIEVPGRARVDSLQAIGGIVGGVAGRGDQAARIAERQAKSTESIEILTRDAYQKLSEIHSMLDGIKQDIS